MRIFQHGGQWNYWILLLVTLKCPKSVNVKSSNLQLPILRKQPLVGVGMVFQWLELLIFLT